jgi:hypothetical protein
MKFSKAENVNFYRTADNFIVTVLVVSFLIGTTTHAIDVIKLGFFGYTRLGHVSQWQNFFWTSLLIIDPVVVFLLIFRRHIGAIAALVVLSADVIINYNYFKGVPGLNIFFGPAFSLQSACLFFSLLTLPKLLINQTENVRIRSIILFYFFNIPVVVLAAGLVIHLKGLFSIPSGGLSLWAIWVHCFMTAFNALLLILIIKQKKIGFQIGIVTFGIFGAIQIIYAAGSFLPARLPFNFEMGNYLGVCCLTISSLLMRLK